MKLRLYRMELYKLLSRKIFVIGAVCTVLFTAGSFWLSNVDMEIAMVDGEQYSGYEAVQINRQITEPYKGTLTDEKVMEIVERYGLPSEVVYDLPGWRDGNYLNTFVTDYLSDGYLQDWNRYKAPTQVYPIADTALGELERVTGREIRLAYTNGWKALLDTLQMGMVLASILVIVTVSTLFAQESQTKMLPLLFTAQDGKERDVRAKIGAAITLTILVYCGTALLCLAMSFLVYGLDGGDWALGMVYLGEASVGNRVSCMPAATFAGSMLEADFAAMLLLCAMTMCASARSRSNFGAVTAAAVLWGIPLLVRMLFGGLGFFLASCMPVFLIMTGTVYDAYSFGWETVMVYPVIVLTVICVVEGWQAYRRQGESAV